jgi:CO/xanthine dehydrogenase Mo-binding subunit
LSSPCSTATRYSSTGPSACTGSGESGYLGAPAAITSAVNDALAPLGLAVNALPIKMTRLADMIAAKSESRSDGK